MVNPKVDDLYMFTQRELLDMFDFLSGVRVSKKATTVDDVLCILYDKFLPLYLDDIAGFDENATSYEGLIDDSHPIEEIRIYNKAIECQHK